MTKPLKTQPLTPLSFKSYTRQPEYTEEEEDK